MRTISVLPDTLINKIAAGEVIERPASVVKELVENAIDAQATSIFTDIEKAGRARVRVSDDGHGMGPEDAPLAMERHGTSKILSDDDLFAITTLGFRGEALPSIAAVSRFEMVTRVRDDESGTQILAEWGGVGEIRECGAPVGTRVTVDRLFENLPARLKFLRTDATEFKHILDVVSRISLAYPSIHFRLDHNGSTVLEAPTVDEMLDRVASVIDEEAAGALCPISFNQGGVRIEGNLSRPGVSRRTSRSMFISVNGRSIKDPGIHRAVMEAYRNAIPQGRYPVVILNMTILPDAVDVNVHPSKREIKFDRPGSIFKIVMNGCRTALGGSTGGLRERMGWPLRNKYDPMVIEIPVCADRRTVEEESGFLWTDRQDRGAGLLSPLESRGPFSAMEVIGSLWGSYILCQAPRAFIMIDQHAAHERIAFERLKAEQAADGVRSQQVLLPLSIKATRLDDAALARVMPAFEHAGLSLEPFGDGTLAVTSIPEILSELDPTAFIEDLIEELTEEGRTSVVEELIDRVLMKIACHSVVRAGRTLKPPEIEALLEDLDRIDFSASCPHGRPVFITQSLSEVERRFGRS